MKEEQMELFSLNCAETGNVNQLLSVSDVQSLAEKCTADDCFPLLSAAGYRNNNGTTMNNVGSNGNYWSSQPYNSSNGQNFNFNGSNYNLNNNNRNNGFPVRCALPEFTSISIPSFPFLHISKERLLTDLFYAYYDARRNKRNTHSQLKFEINMEENLVNLRDELYNHTYRVGRSTCFIIEDPVKREIFAADFRDRVVHHLLYNYISPLFERTFISDSYACRKGKGTHYGVQRLAHHIRSCSKNYTKQCYIMKMDIQGYFMHIDRLHLYDICAETLMKFAYRRSDIGVKWGEKLDYSLIFYLLEQIIMTDPVKDCVIKGKRSDWEGLPDDKSLFFSSPGCGLPIGNLTSQLFSNVYLNKLDQFVKHSLGEKHYGRYVDDFYIVSCERMKLKAELELLRTFLKEELGLTLHPRKTVLMRADYGISYLGAYVKPYRLYLDNKTRKRIFRRVSLLAKEEDRWRLLSGVNSYLGHMKHFKSEKIRERLFGTDVRWSRFGAFTEHYGKYVLNKQ